MSFSEDIIERELQRMQNWIGYATADHTISDYDGEHCARFNTDIGYLQCFSKCCKDKDDIEYFTPSTLCKHWKIKTDPINVWFILQYQCDEKETIPIAELERKRFERRARSKVPQIYHPIIERKFRPKRISKPKVKEEISISSSEPTTPSLSDLVISPKTDNSDEKSSNEHKQEKVKKTRPKKRIRIRDDSSDEDNNMDEDEDVPIPLSIFNLKL